MIFQFGSLFAGLGGLLSQTVSALAPAAIDIGKSFLQRELNKRSRKDQIRQLKVRATTVLNSPGISVATLGGVTAPVGGAVQRSTFFPSAQSPSLFTGVGNVPLPRIPTFLRPAIEVGTNSFELGKRLGDALTSGPLPRQVQRTATLPQPAGEPRFATDQFGKVIKFVISPRPGEGFLPVEQARQLGLAVAKPFWRFNRSQSQFEKIKPRKMNPFNFAAAARAGKRIDRTLDAVKMVVSVQNAKDKGVKCGGKVVRFKTKKKKSSCR